MTNGDELEDETWIGVSEAAEILSVSRVRVTQLIRAGRLPAQMHGRRRWLLRRTQVEVIANARDSRKLRGTLGRD